jgi:hypothetical protein
VDSLKVLCLSDGYGTEDWCLSKVRVDSLKVLCLSDGCGTEDWCLSKVHVDSLKVLCSGSSQQKLFFLLFTRPFVVASSNAAKFL